MANQLLEDPADKQVKGKEEEDLLNLKEAKAARKDKKKAVVDKELNVFDISKFSSKDFQALQPNASRSVQPFEGYEYPLGREATSVVQFIPPVIQDQSGRNYSIRENIDLDEALDFGPYKGMSLSEVRRLDATYFKDTVKMGKVRAASLMTYHNRLIRNYETDMNEDVVFDRDFEMKDGIVRNCAIVPSHNIRAQLVYSLDERTGAIKVDSRYSLLDRAQASRLLQIMRVINAPTRSEQQLVDIVEGISDVIPAEHADLAGEGGG